MFYSFHYGNDIDRVMVVRNRWVTYGGQRASGIIDRAEFMELQRKGDKAIKQWIDAQMRGTTATVVLIVEETLRRPYVRYEIQQSRRRGSAIIGVYVNGIRNLRGQTSSACSRYTVVDRYSDGAPVHFCDLSDGIYDYVPDDGYQNLERWVESAIGRRRA